MDRRTTTLPVAPIPRKWCRRNHVVITPSRGSGVSRTKNNLPMRDVLAFSSKTGFRVPKYCAPHDDCVSLYLVDHFYIWLANRLSTVVQKAPNVALFGQRNADGGIMSKCPLNGHPSSFRVFPLVAPGIDRLLRDGL